MSLTGTVAAGVIMVLRGGTPAPSQAYFAYARQREGAPQMEVRWRVASARSVGEESRGRAAGTNGRAGRQAGRAAGLNERDVAHSLNLSK